MGLCESIITATSGKFGDQLTAQKLLDSYIFNATCNYVYYNLMKIVEDRIILIVRTICVKGELLTLMAHVVRINRIKTTK